MVAVPACPSVRTLARFLVLHADPVALARACTRLHAGTIVSIHLETGEASTIVRRHALPVLAATLAEWRANGLVRLDETLQTLAFHRRDASPVDTGRAGRFARTSRVFRVAIVAGANVRLRASAIPAILLADRLAGRQVLVRDVPGYL